jgi:Ice-binding-like
MNKLFELSPGAMLEIAPARRIRAGDPAPTTHASMKKLSSFLLCAAFAVCPVFAAKKQPPSGLQPVNLGSAAPFAVFGNTGVTNVPAAFTVINGDLGSSIPSVTGFSAEDGGAGIVNGTIDDSDTGPETSAAAHASASLAIAIKDAKGRPCPAGQAIACLLPIAELGGLTLTPGVYTFAGVATLTGILTLSGDGVYIFQLGALTVNPGGTVVLAGAKAANVFWVATQATLNSSAAFAGTILSTTTVTFTAAAGGTVLTGRALAQTAVTFAAADTVTLP